MKAIDEAAVCRAYQAGEGLVAVGSRFGIDHHRVVAILDHHGVKRRRRGRPTKPVPIEVLAADYAAGLSLHEVAAKRGIGHDQVAYRLAAAGIPRRPPGVDGRAFYRDRRRAAEVRARYLLGEPLSTIALRMGLSQDQVCQMIGASA